jgi:uncharacterized protein
MRAAFLTFLLALTVSFSLTSGAAAQGIDCRNPPTGAEVQVCRHPELLELDERMTRRYYRLRDELRGRDRYELEQDQFAWREARRQCKHDPRCVHAIYLRRLDELREYRPGPRGNRQRY